MKQFLLLIFLVGTIGQAKTHSHHPNVRSTVCWNGCEDSQKSCVFSSIPRADCMHYRFNCIEACSGNASPGLQNECWDTCVKFEKSCIFDLDRKQCYDYKWQCMSTCNDLVPVGGAAGCWANCKTTQKDCIFSLDRETCEHKKWTCVSECNCKKAAGQESSCMSNCNTEFSDCKFNLASEICFQYQMQCNTQCNSGCGDPATVQSSVFKKSCEQICASTYNKGTHEGKSHHKYNECLKYACKQDTY